MEQQLNQNKSPMEGSLNKNWLMAIFALAAILVIGSAVWSAYFWWQNYGREPVVCTMEAKLCPDGSYVGRVGPKCEFSACPLVTNSPSPNPTINWQTFGSQALGFTFQYPAEYAAPQERENYLSLISPLNPDRGRGFEAQNGELKIEIVVEPGQENDSTLKCWNDHSSEGGRLTGQSEIFFNGAKTMLLNWEGLGTGQFLCVNHNGRRYLINKYPAETTRQGEYNNILATFKFLN